MTKEIERFQEKDITCPYCGWTDTDSWESDLDSDGDSDVFDCQNEECGKKFQAIVNMETTYTSRGLCEENKVEHNWEEFDHTTDGKRCKGHKCLTCGEYEFDDVSLSQDIKKEEIKNE